MGAAGSGRILTDTALLVRTRALTAQVNAAASLCAARRADHRYRPAEDEADVKVSTWIALEDGATRTANCDLTFETRSETRAAGCRAATA